MIHALCVAEKKHVCYSNRAFEGKAGILLLHDIIVKQRGFNFKDCTPFSNRGERRLKFRKIAKIYLVNKINYFIFVSS